MSIKELQQSWDTENHETLPHIIRQTWHGTQQSPMLVNLWGKQYARIYGWMLSLGITSQLWQDFANWACAEFPSGLVFDAGVGRGDITYQLLDQCPNTQVVGGDWSIPFLQYAQKRFSNAHYQNRVALCQMDLTQPWPQEWRNTFDGVTCNYVAAYLPREAQKALLTEAFRALRKDGVLLFNFMVYGIEFRDVLRYNIPAELRKNPLFLLRALALIPIFTEKVDQAREYNLVQPHTTESFEKVARSIGFREIKIIGWHLPLAGGKYAVPTYKLVK
jgi:ubiquinone/menaquinone biosynthesis C-methylase UbiE